MDSVKSIMIALHILTTISQRHQHYISRIPSTVDHKPSSSVELELYPVRQAGFYLYPKVTLKFIYLYKLVT